jgi:hypothetical protein
MSIIEELDKEFLDAVARASNEGLMLTKQQLDDRFVTALAKALNHVKEVRDRRWEKPYAHPELFGEFITSLRREITILAEAGPAVKQWCHTICSKDMWDDIGKPTTHTWRVGTWNFSCHMATDGAWIMNQLHAQHLAAAADMKARYSMPEEAKSVEIRIALSRLENDIRQLTAAASVASSLNLEADKVVGSLCQIAETLNV